MPNNYVPSVTLCSSFLYLHIREEEWNSISSSESGHVNHKISIIPHMIGEDDSFDIHTITMIKQMRPLVNLCSPPGYRSNGGAIIMALLDKWIGTPSDRSTTSVPGADDAEHCEIGHQGKSLTVLKEVTYTQT